MSLIIRRMTEADVPSVFALEQIANPHPWSRKLIEESLATHHAVVLEEAGKLLGYAFVQRIVDEAHLLDIAIEPAQRRRGLAKTLMRYLLDECFQDRISIWLLEVRVSNAPAIALYTALGFNEMGIRRNYYQSRQGREDALLMGLSCGL